MSCRQFWTGKSPKRARYCYLLKKAVILFCIGFPLHHSFRSRCLMLFWRSFREDIFWMMQTLISWMLQILIAVQIRSSIRSASCAAGFTVAWLSPPDDRLSWLDYHRAITQPRFDRASAPIRGQSYPSYNASAPARLADPQRLRGGACDAGGSM